MNIIFLCIIEVIVVLVVSRLTARMKYINGLATLRSVVVWFLSMVLVVTVLLTALMGTASEQSLKQLYMFRIEKNELKNVDTSLSCEIVKKDGVLEEKFYISGATSQIDLENFIGDTKTVYMCLCNGDNIEYEYQFDSDKQDRILQVYNEWQSSGKIDMHSFRVYFGKFYIDQNF